MAFREADSASCIMSADSTRSELPPGLLEEYLESAQGQLAYLAGIAGRLAARNDDTEALDELRREVHKIHGSAGSYGFWPASRLAAGMEETAKDWVGRPHDTEVDRGSLTHWFVVRLAAALGLEAPPAGRGAPPPEPAPSPPVAADQAGTAEIIVVEDDPALADLLIYGLRSRGYRFQLFRNGREALDALLAFEPGVGAGEQHPLLLLDVDLPALDGYSIFDTLQRDRPGRFRVVFTTVHGDESEQLRGLEAGALDYLVKPISLRVALEKIRRWVGR